jgi:threonine dehydrogenase-like Zn-dependent dehydrogenase
MSMRGVVMHAPGDVRVVERESPTILEPTDAIIRLAATCICGSDLWPYRGVEAVDDTPMGHEYVGVVEEIGDAVKTIRVGDFVVGSFVISEHLRDLPRRVSVALCPPDVRLPDRHPVREGPHSVCRRHPRRHADAAGPGPDRLAAGRLGRARYGLVRRRRGGGRAGQDGRHGR